MTGPRKIPFWATLFTLCGLIVLCGLGTWQLQRLEWKRGIIEQLKSACDAGSAAPLDLEADYTCGRIEGVFLPRKAILLGPRVKDGKVGKDLVAPLRLEGKTLFVNMGWTDAPLEDLAIYHLDGKNVAFTGLLRAPLWNAFTPDNLPGKDTWYKPDPAEIAAAKDLPDPLPKILYAESANYKFDAAFPNNERWQPRNDHLSYAVFWFAMAGTLALIYVLRFIRKN